MITELGRALGRKNGVDSFEVLLRQFDLDGDVGDQIKKHIWQTHDIRNVIVHRASLADRRLIDACPWLGLAWNQKIIVTDTMLYECAGALCHYALTVTHRLGK